MHRIVHDPKEYKIITKDMEVGEKAVCEDDSLEVEKQADESFVLVVKKGSLKKMV